MQSEAKARFIVRAKIPFIQPTELTWPNFHSYFVLMFQVLLTTTEVDAIERAFAIAFDVGRLPDSAIDGDGVRISALRKSLRAAQEAHAADSWWGTKAKRNDREP